MTTGLLSGLTVLDLSESIAGQFCSRVMADHGAWTALIEPPGGSAIRRMPPFRGDGGESLLFWHLNGGKQSITLDAADPTRRDDLIALCRDADVIVVGDREHARMLEAACPEAVVGLVTDFGGDGPYAEWTGSELIFQALSGTMYITGAADREPLYGVGHRVSYAAGLWLYIDILGALCGRLHNHLSYGPIEVSIHEAAVAMEENFSFRFGYNGYVMPRGGDSGRAVASLECSDGWAVLFLRSGGTEWQRICGIVGAGDLAGDPRFASWPLIFKNWATARAELGRHTRNMTVAQLVEACEQAEIVIARVETAASLRDERHLAQRNYWQKVDGDKVALGPLFQIPAAPALRDRPAPLPGSTDHPPARRDRPSAPRKADSHSPLPLTGIAALDFTTAWAGPMSTKILAHLGVDVIKMEGPRWYDSWRGLPNPTKREQYPGDDPGAKPYNRCALFNAQNLNKRAIVLDLKSERARDIIRAMIPKIDIVVANFRPGALARQGLGFDVLHKLNAGTSLIEMPAVGSGPFEHRIGLGPTMEAMAGITAHIGHDDGRPLGSGSSYLDPTGALHGAAASLTALYRRLVSGEGSHVEIAQREAAMQWIGEVLLEALDRGQQQPLQGNAIDHACPHDAFRTKGDEQWIAIAAFTEAQWQALCGVLQRPQWRDDPRFADLKTRVVHRAALDGLVADATRSWDKVALAAALQAAGVPAAPVMNGPDVFGDPHLRARGWFTRLPHAEVGEHDYPGYPLHVGGARYRPRRASPLFGEHTQAVLAEMAGLSHADVMALAAEGITSDRPLPMAKR